MCACAECARACVRVCAPVSRVCAWAQSHTLLYNYVVVFNFILGRYYFWLQYRDGNYIRVLYFSLNVSVAYEMITFIVNKVRVRVDSLHTIDTPNVACYHSEGAAAASLLTRATLASIEYSIMLLIQLFTLDKIFFRAK